MPKLDPRLTKACLVLDSAVHGTVVSTDQLKAAAILISLRPEAAMKEFIHLHGMLSAALRGEEVD